MQLSVLLIAALKFLKNESILLCLTFLLYSWHFCPLTWPLHSTMTFIMILHRMITVLTITKVRMTTAIWPIMMTRPAMRTTTIVKDIPTMTIIVLKMIITIPTLRGLEDSIDLT